MFFSKYWLDIILPFILLLAFFFVVAYLKNKGIRK